MDKLEKKNDKKRKKKNNGIFTKSIRYKWYDLLCNYIPEPIKTMDGVKDQVMNLLKPKIMVNQNI